MIGEYSRYKNGEYVRVLDLNDCLDAIKIRNEDLEEQVRNLQETNKKLRDDNYKDEELQKMKKELEQFKEEYYRGFPISEEEGQAIAAWKSNHKKGIPNWHKASYTYIFEPTSLGIVGTIKCNCGKEFTFRELN